MAKDIIYGEDARKLFRQVLISLQTQLKLHSVRKDAM